MRMPRADAKRGSGRRPSTSTRLQTRDTYRHGDLRHALVVAGVDLARKGGPGAVVLRELTRRVGVTPNAAYRHFADQRALLKAVCAVAQSELAVTIENELAALPALPDPADQARARLRAVGTAYLRFAQAEPGLFETAFSVPEELDEASNTNRGGASGLTPYQLLNTALDDLVRSGALSAARRRNAQFAAWSAVHGLAMLFVAGPLRSLDEACIQEIGERLLDMVSNGI
jgi:AcrR family transcriptional regulator